jgi:diguanylate cyclase (GGDEF)-like protein/PAS domain S-box-containing protein
MNQRLQRLRAKAEAQLASIGLSKESVWTLVGDELLHELHVRQIELEMQNEELHRLQVALETSYAHYLELYDFAPVGYLTLTAEGMVSEINLTGAKLLGMERKHLINRCFTRFIDDQDKDRWHRLFLMMMKDTGGERQCFDLPLKRPDGGTQHTHFDCLCWAGEAGDKATSQLRIILADITQCRQTEELRIAAIAFETQEAMMVTDANGIILNVNRAFTETTGYPAEEAVGRMPRILKSGCHDADFYAGMWESLQCTGAWTGEIWDRRKNGEIYPNWALINAVKDNNGTITHYVAAYVDITDQKAATDEIERLAFYDPLTELPNRRLLLDRLQQELVSSERRGLTGALLFIDLDNFKALNDTLGHNKGDLLLRQVARRLVSCVRENDTVARLGGDEFVVLLKNLSMDVGEAAAQAKISGEKIIATLNEAYQLDGHEHSSTPSIGVVLFNSHEHPADELLKRADIALYQAKAAGRNTLRFFDPKMQSAIEARVRLVRDLRRALAEKQFTLYYQKQVNRNGQVIGAEVLIRWQHPERGLVSPLDFIPTAEETALILPIGQWVLETACAQIKQWENHPQAGNLQLAVNVSARQFHQPDFVRLVCNEIEKFAINPSKLKLELTESLVLDNIADTILKMKTLREIGVHFSLDDFGTGYSSLSYLTQLPLDQIKIDQSFVHNIGIKPSDAVIVQTIIGMTKNLDIEVISEGVETKGQRDFLELHGCPLYQGWLFGEPVTLEAFEKLLR